MESGFKDINGAELFYERKGTGRTVVFIHGFSLDHRLWNPQFDEFALQYDCLRYDMRGFGRSSLPQKKAKYSHQSDLLALLKELNVTEPVALVGLSLGGRVAVNFTLNYPEMVSALIIADGVVDGFDYRHMNFNHIYESGIKEGAQTANDKWIRHPIFEPAMKNNESAALLTEMLTGYSGWHWANRNPIAAPADKPDAIERLHEINAPTLIVLGENENKDFIEVAEIMNAGIPHSEKIYISGAGHISNLEQPEEFNKIVLSYLKRTLQN